MADITMITESEAMQKIGVTSRTTMRNYGINHAFPKPVRNRPKQYLLAEVERWILNGGVNQRCQPETNHAITEAYRALDQKIDNAKPVMVPDGWKLVPVDPTAEMVWAAKGVLGNTVGWDYFLNAYGAMLVAAPEVGR